MDSKDQIMQKLDEAIKSYKPINISVDGIQSEIFIIAIDDIQALGKGGGVISFYFAEKDND